MRQKTEQISPAEAWFHEGIDIDQGKLSFTLPTVSFALIPPSKVWLGKGLHGQQSVFWSEREPSHTARRIAEDKGQPIKDRSVEAAGCLQAFVRLSDASESEIKAFTRKWGVLGLYPQVISTPDPVSFHFATVEAYSEPVDVYRKRARQMRAVIEVSRRLRAFKRALRPDVYEAHGEYYDLVAALTPREIALTNDTWAETWQGHDEKAAKLFAEWDDLVSDNREMGRSMPEAEAVRRQRRFVSQLVSEWLRESRVLPSLTWGDAETCDLSVVPQFDTGTWDHVKRLLDHDEWSRELMDAPQWLARNIGPRPSRLWTALTLQLAASLVSKARYYKCDICGSVFERDAAKSKLRADRPRLCSKDCRDKRHSILSAKSQQKAKEKRNHPHAQTADAAGSGTE